MVYIALPAAALVLVFAIPPGWVARSRRTLFIFDIALLLGAPVLFILSAVLLNPPLQTGWGMIVYPFVALAVAVSVFYFRVFVLDRLNRNPRSNSALCLLSAAAVAVLMGAVLPPWYD